jgi:hypothetical protein
MIGPGIVVDVLRSVTESTVTDTLPTTTGDAPIQYESIARPWGSLSGSEIFVLNQLTSGATHIRKNLCQLKTKTTESHSPNCNP